MPVVADSAYQTRKAGGALENAAEEILNGIFCHYEPPTSTKAQKNAAKAVRKNPSKFLYEEQPTKPLLLKKKKVITTPSSDRDYESGSDYNYDTDTDIGEYEEEDEATLEEQQQQQQQEENIIQEQTLLKVQVQQPETPSKRGIKWRDEESKRIEQEREKAKAASSWSQCMTLPCFTADGHEIPGTLEDIQDENIVPQEPTPLGAATPTKSALKRRDDDTMRVLYDDQGNPNTTPKSPGSIKNHAFFRNVTNSPRAQFYEPKDYNQPSTPTGTGFKMPRDFTPRPNKTYPAPPSDIGVPPSPAAATVQLPAPPTPKAVENVVMAPRSPMQQQVAHMSPRSPMQVSQIPGSSGVSEYQFSRDHIAAPPQRIRQIGPLPGSPGIKDQHGGPNVIRLAKIGRRSVQAAHSPRPIASVAAAAAAAADQQQTWRGVDPAMAQTGSYVAKSPKSYMAPAVVAPTAAAPAPGQPQPLQQPSADIETPAQISVLQAVQMLNKAGFNPGRRFNRGFNAKAFKIKAPPKSPSAQQHHGYAAATAQNNDNRDSFEGENKPSFVGTRRVAPPTALVAPSSSNPTSNSALLKEIKHSRAAPAPGFRQLELNTDLRDELEMARDPTPRQMKIQELEDGLRFANNHGGPLPPTPRRKKEEEPEYTTRPTPTAQKPPQHFVPANTTSGSERTAVVVPPPKESKKKETQSKKQKKEQQQQQQQKKVEKKTSQRRVKTESTTLAPAPASSTSRPKSQSRSSSQQQPRQTQSRSTSQNNKNKKKEKKGFMSGLKKGLGKLKNTVNEIDSQRIPEPVPKKKSREVRMA